jgi:phosphoglycolate phosphatase
MTGSPITHRFDLIVFDWEGTLFDSSPAGAQEGRLFPGVHALVESLKAKRRRLAIATGASRRELDDAMLVAQLNGIFDSSRTAEETAGKPEPLMLHELMRELGTPPERTLMVGDSAYDLQMARNAGCARVGVCYRASPPAAFAALAPLFVAPSVRELHDWLAENA